MAWTKAKSAIVVAASVLLAAGTTTVVVHEVAGPHLSATDLSWANNPRYWKMDSRVLEKNPPVFILRKTKFPRGGGSMQVGQRFGGTKMLYENASLATLISTAYQVNEVRTILPEGLPQERFDLMLTKSGDAHKMLQDELKHQFGITAHRETLDTDVFYLTKNSADAPGLTLTKGGNQYWSGQDGGNYNVQTMTDIPFQNTTYFFESTLKRPVFDRTGLTNKYDMHLKWSGTGGVQAFRDAIRDQLGLETTEGREPVQMLVVEHSETLQTAK